jgi:SAM-dependent methyltransferase
VLQRVGLQRIPSVGHRPLDISNDPVFGEFTTEDGRRLPLHATCRDLVKNWRLSYWPTAALWRLRGRVPLDESIERDMAALAAAHTLLAPLDEYAAAVGRLAARHPDLLQPSTMPSDDTSVPVIAVRPTAPEVQAIAGYYQRLARRLLKEYLRWTRPVPDVGKIRVLETGCGMGYSVVAMAQLGVAHAAGIDRTENDERSICEAPLVLQSLGVSTPNPVPRARIVTGDMRELPFDDQEFDFIHSSAVLEHVHDTAVAFREMRRVLKPGGTMIHAFYPFFGFAGGHASCTLDFPWGHARLSRADFQRYLAIFRPHERLSAETLYDRHFPTPRVSLAEIEQALSAAGLSILSWREDWRVDRLPSSDVCREVMAHHVSTTPRDVAADGVTFVAVRD